MAAPAPAQAASKGAAEAVKPAAGESSIGLFRTRFVSFVAGFAVASVVGYMRLRDDVTSSAEYVNTAVDAARRDVEVLQSRNAALEDRVARLEAARSS